MHPSPQTQTSLEQQYYYASLPSHGSVPYHQYPSYYTGDQQQYVMTGPQQPVMIPMPQSFVYVPQPQVATHPAYMPNIYGGAPNVQQIYYENMFLHPPTTTLQNGQITHEAHGMGPLSTSTPLPTEYIALPPPMTNQVPYSGVRTAHIKYHKSLEPDDLLANVSKISKTSDAADETMCDSERPSQQQKSSQNSANFKTRLCITHAAGKECMMGSRCKFAHGTEELRQVEQKPLNLRFKTRMCKNFTLAANKGTLPICPYDDRCEFIHPNDKEFATLPQNLRNTIAAALSVGNNQANITPEMISDYYSPGITRSAAKAAPEKILLKNRNVVGSMMCLTGATRRDDDSAICSGSSESGSSMQSTRMRGRNSLVPVAAKFMRRRSMSQQTMKKWNSMEAINTEIHA